MKNKKVIIVGAGPGGLSSAMILSNKGYDVTVYEKHYQVGGRTSPIKVDGYTFDLGPTFVMLPQAFEEVFSLSNAKISDYMDWKKLDVLYNLNFNDNRVFSIYDNKEEFKKEIKRLFPGDEINYEKYMKDQKEKFDHMYPCLKVPYEKWYHYFRLKLLKAVPYMDLNKSVYGVLSKYFKNEDMRISMTFQAKYLGMSPWNCPGPFTILSYIEHAFGIYHPIGGVHKITESMAQVAIKNGAKIILNKSVKEILVENKKISGVMFEDNSVDKADIVIMNSDFAYSMKNLIPEKYRQSWKDKKIEEAEYSCSTFMMYLGVDKKYDNLSHHNIFFAKDYKENIKEIFDKNILPQDPSFYIQNASLTDSTLAPEGCSTIYVLVPVPNLKKGNIDWDIEKNKYRDLIIDQIIKKTDMKDIKDHIRVERIITPKDFENNINVYKGAVFNISHTLNQMLYFRPHNEFEDINGLYLVGGGTHPGSGLPTILESGRIAADLIESKYK